MKNKKSIVIIFALLAVLIISGCEKVENPVDSGNDNTPTSSYPTPTNFGGATPSNTLAVIRTSISQMGFSFSLGVGVANLNNQDKGTVTATVSGDNFEFTKHTNGSVVSYVYVPSQTNPTGGITLGSGSESATFSVSNYPLSNSTVTVPGEISLTAPAADASVPRSADLNITWSASNAGTNRAIFIVDHAGKSIYKEVSGNGGTFTSTEMSTLAAGTGLVYAITYNFVLTNNNDAVLIGEAIATNNITLQ